MSSLNYTPNYNSNKMDNYHNYKNKYIKSVGGGFSFEVFPFSIDYGVEVGINFSYNLSENQVFPEIASIRFVY